MSIDLKQIIIHGRIKEFEDLFIDTDFNEEQLKMYKILRQQCANNVFQSMKQTAQKGDIKGIEKIIAGIKISKYYKENKKIKNTITILRNECYTRSKMKLFFFSSAGLFSDFDGLVNEMKLFEHYQNLLYQDEAFNTSLRNECYNNAVINENSVFAEKIIFLSRNPPDSFNNSLLLHWIKLENKLLNDKNLNVDESKKQEFLKNYGIIKYFFNIMPGM